MKKALLLGAAALTLASCQPCAKKAPVPAANYDNILVVVDLQRDFFDPSGSLYVGGSEVLPEKIAAIATNYDAIIFTLDWHPANHCSFKEQGGLWPSHCVAYTQGAGLPDCLAAVMKEKPCQMMQKGCNPAKEEYGAFESMDGFDEIASWLKGCKTIDVCGIAGDYCVKESVNTLLNYVDVSKVSILTECVRSIDDGSTLEAFMKEKKIARK